ncbi:MAG: ISAzo13 family transposase [Deltaproteobacteria bacterium]|nr:ISAzo13 family transposase [Deltaproteobacteria bacterium]
MIIRQFTLIGPHLQDERLRRIWAGSAAESIGYGGISLVARVTGMSPKTVARGIADSRADPDPAGHYRIRQPGGGRKPAEISQPGLLEALESLIDPVSRGNRDSPLRWTCKSTRELSAELGKRGFTASNCLVDHLLHGLGYCLRGSRKSSERNRNSSREKQFEFINRMAEKMIRQNNPVLSIATRKREMPEGFPDAGGRRGPKGRPAGAERLAFPAPGPLESVPFGTAETVGRQRSVTTVAGHERPLFAVESIRRWWHEAGGKTYGGCTELMIAADCGGIDSPWSGAFDLELQRLCEDIGTPISVCHFPPGTSKWNKVEHLLSTFIARNWRARPLADLETVVSLIGPRKAVTGQTERRR